MNLYDEIKKRNHLIHYKEQCTNGVWKFQENWGELVLSQKLSFGHLTRL